MEHKDISARKNSYDSCNQQSYIRIKNGCRRNNGSKWQLETGVIKHHILAHYMLAAHTPSLKRFSAQVNVSMETPRLWENKMYSSGRLRHIISPLRTRPNGSNIEKSKFVIGPANLFWGQLQFWLSCKTNIGTSSQREGDAS